jgi:type IV pilus assembly protein PilB
VERDEDLQQFLRRVGADGEETTPVEPQPHPGAGIEPNAITQLVADLLETTGLVPADRLAQARARAGTGSLAQALVEEGIAEGTGVARVAAQHSHLPLIDLQAEDIDRTAANAIPTHVLTRAVALPYRLEGDRLFVAIADPTNVQTIDELRLATRYTLELGVAPREDIEVELRRRRKRRAPTSRPMTESRTLRSFAS